MNKIYSSDGTLLIEGTHKQATGLCYFNTQILQGDDTNVPVMLSAINISQSNLWHQRLAHANYEVIRALPTEMTSGPDQKIQLPLKVCDGCEKGQSERLPFPPLTSRAKHVLDLVHSDLDEISSASIDRYIYTATCQIGIEISDYTGDKISVGVARPSCIGQSVPCDG